MRRDMHMAILTLRSSLQFSDLYLYLVDLSSFSSYPLHSDNSLIPLFALSLPVKSNDKTLPLLVYILCGFEQVVHHSTLGVSSSL